MSYLTCHSSSVGSLVRPKVVRSVHYCPATKKTMERKYTDMTSLDAFPSSAIYPTKVIYSSFALLSAVNSFLKSTVMKMANVEGVF